MFAPSQRIPKERVSYQNPFPPRRQTTQPANESSRRTSGSERTATETPNGGVGRIRHSLSNRVHHSVWGTRVRRHGHCCKDTGRSRWNSEDAFVHGIEMRGRSGWSDRFGLHGGDQGHPFKRVPSGRVSHQGASAHRTTSCGSGVHGSRDSP